MLNFMHSVIKEYTHTRFLPGSFNPIYVKKKKK